MRDLYPIDYILHERMQVALFTAFLNELHIEALHHYSKDIGLLLLICENE